MSGEILEVKEDTKKLYQVVNGMTGSVKENPLPHCDLDIELANKFADYFMKKIIIKIRTMFDNISKMDFVDNESIPQFTKFAPLSEAEVKKLINGMKTKSCELDPIPTRIIKENLE